MANMTIWYEGDLSTRVLHEGNHAEIYTDAPKEVSGLGRHFSPTDLVAVALGTCVLTLMGMAAKSLHIDIQGTRASVSKKMHTSSPRRIQSIRIEIFCPHTFQEGTTLALIQAAETCPVHASLHPEMQKEFVYHWGTP